MNDDNHSGYANAVCVIISMIGIASALHPKWLWLTTLTQYKDDLRNVLPFAIGGFGTIGAAVTRPNSKLHGWLQDARFWVGSFFRGKPTV